MAADILLILDPQEAELLDRVLTDAVRSGKLLGLLKTTDEDERLLRAMIKLKRATGTR